MNQGRDAWCTLQASHLLALRFARDLKTFFIEWRRAAAQGNGHRTILRKCLARLRSQTTCMVIREWAYRAAKAGMLRRAHAHARQVRLAQGLAAFAVNREQAIMGRALQCAMRLQLGR